jgi:hypothetical protein
VRLAVLGCWSISTDEFGESGMAVGHARRLPPRRRNGMPWVI